MKTWLLPYPFKIAGYVVMIATILLLVANTYLEISMGDELDWMIGVAHVGLYISMLLTSLSREKVEDEMTAQMRGKALKEVGYVVLIVYAAYHIVRTLMGDLTYILHDEELITPFIAWVLYYGRFKRHLRKMGNRHFTL